MVMNGESGAGLLCFQPPDAFAPLPPCLRPPLCQLEGQLLQFADTLYHGDIVKRKNLWKSRKKIYFFFYLQSYQIWSFCCLPVNFM